MLKLYNWNQIKVARIASLSKIINKWQHSSLQKQPSKYPQDKNSHFIVAHYNGEVPRELY